MQNDNPDQIKDNPALDEQELEVAAGGAAGGDICHFTWTGKEEKRLTGSNFEEMSHWVECASRASTCPFCSCHGTAHCVARWHRLESGEAYRLALGPVYHYNHKFKQRENNYNTYY